MHQPVPTALAPSFAQASSLLSSSDIPPLLDTLSPAVESSSPYGSFSLDPVDLSSKDLDDLITDEVEVTPSSKCYPFKREITGD